MNYDRVKVTPEITKQIQDNIRTFGKGGLKQRQWLAPLALEYNILPLLGCFVETTGIMPDGRIRKFYDDGAPKDYEGLKFAGDRATFIGALTEGAKYYSFLRLLTPERPRDAIDCRVCKMSKNQYQERNLICSCGNVGWLNANEIV